jgi:N6-adenosine-specific RNA methylase IME4
MKGISLGHSLRENSVGTTQVQGASPTVPAKRYQIIYADPPWKYEFSHTRSRAINDYPTLDKESICAFPIKDIAEDNSMLLMWITFPKLEWAIPVMNAWGFKYITNAFTWIKHNKKEPSLFWGMGYYTRSNAEICLLGRRGDGVKAISHSIHSVIQTPIEKHSKKPEETKHRIEKLFGNVSRVELFARQKTEGWDVWGNEVESDIDLTHNQGEL